MERPLYEDRGDQDGLCVSPMDLTLGIIAELWTLRATQLALWVVAQMTPTKGAERLERVGNVKPDTVQDPSPSATNCLRKHPGARRKPHDS